MHEYQHLSSLLPVISGEVSSINSACGNGWRKIFNVYAKLLYALDKNYFDFSTFATTWQNYRDSFLLQHKSKTALLFSPPQPSANEKTLHIICGKTYARQLLASNQITANFDWLDDEFAIDKAQNLIICPYFDYRQLSNCKIEKLSTLLTELAKLNKLSVRN